MTPKAIAYYEVSAFSKEPFAGNPAGVCPLDEWLPDATLQNIAAQNNLSETAFFVREVDKYGLRWFTPTLEAELCGHATLASAHVLFHHLGVGEKTVRFDSLSGPLSVSRDEARLVLDFPSQPPTPLAGTHHELDDALGAAPQQVFLDRDYLAVFRNQTEIQALQPDLAAVSRLNASAVIVTAPGDNCDFVSRYFAPNHGIPEDPVTGSIHCALVPYWSQRLQKKTLFARQVSPRGGDLFCEDRGQRVLIGGAAVTFLTGQIHISTNQ